MANITASQIIDIKLKAEQMWSDAQFSADFTPEAEAAKAVIANQTARFKELEDRTKDKQVKVTWIKSCGVEVEDGGANCELDEEGLDTDSESYGYDIYKKVGFSVNREKLRTNTYSLEEFTARGIASRVKALDEFWAQQCLVKAKSFAGVNLAPESFTFDATKNATIVPATLYGSITSPVSGFRLPTAWKKQGRKNKIVQPYFIDNGRLYHDFEDTKLQADGTNGADKGGGRRANALNLTSDLFNFDDAGITNVSTFMIGKNAMAFKTYNRHADAIVELGSKVGQTHFTIDSIALAGVKYDVIYELTCKVGDNGETEYIDTWRIITRGGIWSNPEGCPVTKTGTNPPAGTYNPTGILAYVSSDETI